MELKSFADVQAFLSGIITPGAPHGPFWTTLTYNEFVTGTVPGVIDPVTKQKVPILTKGDGKNSNIVQALQGTGLFDPATGDLPRMPYNGPYLNDAQIQPLSDWITGPPGCAE